MSVEQWFIVGLFAVNIVQGILGYRERYDRNEALRCGHNELEAAYVNGWRARGEMEKEAREHAHQERMKS